LASLLGAVFLPAFFVALVVRKDVFNINHLSRVIDAHDQPILIAADVEDRAFLNGIGVRKNLSHFS
jgi:hypothetical protein